MSDEAFERFLKSSQGGLPSAPFFVMVTIKEKMDGIVGMYKATLEALKETPDKGPATYRGKLELFATKLMKKAELTIDQFDYLIADTMEDEESKGGNDDK